MVGAGDSNRLVTRFGTTGDVVAQLPAQAAGPAADNAGAAMENARRWRLPWPGC
jgi:hypothetical protein